MMSNVSIAARLDRLPITRLHKKATALIGTGIFFDLFDIFLAGVMSTVLVEQFHVAEKLLPLLLGSSFLGMFIGAIVLGGMADRLGRKKAFMYNLAIYSIFSLLAAFSPNVGLLIVFRFIAGLGLGAEPPLCDAYLSELLPASKRGKYIAWAYTFAFLAMPVEGFLAKFLVPVQFLGLEGWRLLFIIGSVGSLIVWVWRMHLPESPRWLEAVGRLEEANQITARLEEEAKALTELEPVMVASPLQKPNTSFSILFKKAYLRSTLMLWFFHILQTIGYYGFGTLVPLILKAKGYPVLHSLEYTALTFLGYPIGSLLSLPLIERIDRKWLIVLSAFLMAVFGISFGVAKIPSLIVVFGVLYTLVSNVFSNAFHIYQAEIFPTSVRATAAGTAYSLSRLMSGLMPFLLLPVLKHYGTTAMFTVVAAAMGLIIVDIGLLGPRTTGRSLEEVNEEGDFPAAGSTTHM
jgi:MFS transporter, putative metabolite:H+ symporter